MAGSEGHDEVTGRPIEAVQDVASLTRDWLVRVWSQRGRTEWAVAWYLPLLTAAVALIVALVSSVPMWLAQHGGGEPERAFPVGRWLLRTLIDVPWRGAFLGLGLLAFDRIAGKWRRPLRWAVAALLFPGLLAGFIPSPTHWLSLPWLLRAEGILGALGFVRPWTSWLWVLGSALCSAAWAWWVARDANAADRPYRRLAQAGAEAAVVVSLLVTLATIPQLISFARQDSLGWTALWGSEALGLATAALKGALNGLAIAIALWAGRPKAAAHDASSGTC